MFWDTNTKHSVFLSFRQHTTKIKSETNTKEALEVLGEVGGVGWVGNFQKKIPIRQKRAKKILYGKP